MRAAQASATAAALDAQITSNPTFDDIKKWNEAILSAVIPAVDKSMLRAKGEPFLSFALPARIQFIDLV